MNRFKEVCLLLLASAALATVSPALAEECSRTSLEGQIKSIHYAVRAGAWESNRIVATDQYNERTYEIRLGRGESRDLPDFEIFEASELSQKAARAAFSDEVTHGIRKADGGFIQVVLGPKPYRKPVALNWFDREFGMRGRVDIQGKVGSKGGEIESEVLSLVQWVPLGGRIFAYGALGIAGRPNKYTYGFFTTDMRAPNSPNLKPLRGTLVMHSRNFEYQAFNSHPYLAADNSGIAYFLDLGEYAELWAFDIRSDELKPLNGFPSANQRLTPFESAPPDQMGKTVEEMAGPVGLYTDGSGMLYALFREPSRLGSSTWTLHKLAPNPSNETVTSLGAVRLPTQAETRHVMLLPSESGGDWIFFESDSIEFDEMENRPSIQPPLAVVTVPEEWFTDPESSPLSTTRKRQPTCLTAQ